MKRIIPLCEGNKIFSCSSLESDRSTGYISSDQRSIDSIVESLLVIRFTREIQSGVRSVKVERDEKRTKVKVSSRKERRSVRDEQQRGELAAGNNRHAIPRSWESLSNRNFLRD